MSYAHALNFIQETESYVGILAACNADAQTWKGCAGDHARECRREILVGADLIPRMVLPEEEVQE